MAQRFTEPGHLPEEGSRFDGRELQPLARGGQTIELDTSTLEQEEHLGFILLGIENLALATCTHLGLLLESSHRLRLQVTEDIHSEQALAILLCCDQSRWACKVSSPVQE